MGGWLDSGGCPTKQISGGCRWGHGACCSTACGRVGLDIVYRMAGVGETGGSWAWHACDGGRQGSAMPSRGGGQAAARGAGT